MNAENPAGDLPEDTLEHVLGLERELQTPACRRDESRLRELLAPDFLEIGASGRRWDLDGVLAMLRKESVADDRGEIVMTAAEARTLAPGVVQVLWDSDVDGRRARRTAIWREADGRWQLAYHQGTPLS